MKINGMSIKIWIIRKLGGISNEDHEFFRSSCENWAVEHLTGYRGDITPNSPNYFADKDDEIVVIRSRISVFCAENNFVKVAPWCIYTSITNHKPEKKVPVPLVDYNH